MSWCRKRPSVAFAEVGRRIVWCGTGVEEIGLDARSNQTLVQIDPRYFRPTEVDLLLGDPTKAQMKLGWTHTTRFEALVAEMVAADLAALKRSAVKRFERD